MYRTDRQVALLAISDASVINRQCRLSLLLLRGDHDITVDITNKYLEFVDS